MTQPLITRLSKLDAPDREVDREICKHLGLLSSMTCEYNHWPLRVTSSVDAAITLAERVLPGWKWYAGNWNVHAAVLSPDRNSDQRAVAATPAIALCIAVLKGHAAILRAKEASHGE